MFLFWVLRRQEQISELDLEIKSAKIKSAKTGAKVSQKRHYMKNKEASLDLLSDTEPGTASVHPLTKEKMYVQVAPSADPGIIYIYIHAWAGPRPLVQACIYIYICFLLVSPHDGTSRGLTVKRTPDVPRPDTQHLNPLGQNSSQL